MHTNAAAGALVTCHWSPVESTRLFLLLLFLAWQSCRGGPYTPILTTLSSPVHRSNVSSESINLALPHQAIPFAHEFLTFTCYHVKDHFLTQLPRKTSAVKGKIEQASKQTWQGQTTGQGIWCINCFNEALKGDQFEFANEMNNVTLNWANANEIAFYSQSYIYTH